MGTVGRLLFREDFNVANGFVSSAVWANSVTGANLTITSAAARFALAGTTAAYGEFGMMVSNLPIPSPNFEILADITVSSIAESFWAISVGGGVMNGYIQQNGYVIVGAPSYPLLGFSRYDGTTEAILAQDLAFVPSAGVVQHVRYRCESGQHAVKAWNGTNPEPAGWKLFARDSTYMALANRRLSFGYMNGNVAAPAKTADLDFIEVREVIVGHRRRAGVR